MEQGLEGYRTCRQCDKTFLATTEWFHRNKTAKNGLRRTCKACDRSIGSRLGTGKFGLVSSDDYYYARAYGFQAGEYERRLQEQGGVCAVCDQPPKKYRLSVDHDHVTGKVRGLLCNNCNRALPRVDRLVAYLQKHAAKE